MSSYEETVEIEEADHDACSTKIYDESDLSELFEENFEDLDIEDYDEFESMFERSYTPRNVHIFNHITSSNMMVSQWLTEAPSDLEEQWLVKLCPRGIRSIVIAQGKITKAYNKKGKCCSRFFSRLPGGGPESRTYTQLTVLDCIYNKDLECYYVIDMLYWNTTKSQRSLSTDPAEVRFFFVKSKLDETPELKQRNESNEFPFLEVEAFSATLSLIQGKLSRPYMLDDQAVALDGVLFYDKSSCFESSTQLTGWLKPFMVPEILHVPVNDCFMEKPEGYVSLEEHLKSRKLHEKIYCTEEEFYSSEQGVEDSGIEEYHENTFCNNLMLSEWFTDIPSNLESQWLVKLCPTGVRNLVVAHDKTTKAYNRGGMCRSIFFSELPGGNPQSESGSLTVLDCIFNRELEYYFVLDVLQWDCSEVSHSSAEERFKFLELKLNKASTLKETTTNNKYPFNHIEAFPAELHLLQSKLSSPFSIKEEVIPLDGILFYERSTPYIESITPFVGWLKPFMLPEMLHVDVHECFTKMKFKDYASRCGDLNLW